MSVVVEIPVSDVRVPEHRARTLRPAMVEVIAASIARSPGRPFTSPIVVRADMTLVAGLHRLRAFQRLGRDTIPGYVLALDSIDAEIVEIEENLNRAELTALERAEQTARLKALYLEQNPETAKGVAGGHGKAAAEGKKLQPSHASFAADIAARTGRSARSVERDAQIGEALTPAAREIVRGTPVADSRRQLLELARVAPEEQAGVAAAVASGDATSVGHAKAQSAGKVGMTDRNGRELPPHVAETYIVTRTNLQALRGHFKAAFAAQDQFRRDIEAIGKARGRAMGIGTMMTNRRAAHLQGLSDIVGVIDVSAPHSLCPYCLGDGEPCGPCNTLGWVTAVDLGGMSDDIRLFSATDEERVKLRQRAGARREVANG